MPRLKPIQTMPDEPLELPLMTGDGTFHIYRIQPAKAESWFRFSALGQAFEDLDAGRPVAPADQDAVDSVIGLGVVGVHAATLGSAVVEAMIADGVSAADIRRAHATALVWHVSGGNLDKAEAAWETGEATPEPESTSTTTAPATTTPIRKPGSSTTSRPRSSKSSTVRSA